MDVSVIITISEAVENVRIEMKGDHKALKTSVDDLGSNRLT